MLKSIKGIAATAALTITGALVPVYEAAADIIIIICGATECLIIIIY